MKQIVMAIFALFIGSGAIAQQKEAFPKTIQVTGSAELEIVPDEIYVVVTLKEYDKKGSGKIALDKIKSDFLGYCKSIGLHDTAVSIAAYEGDDDNTWWRKRKNKDEKLHRSISYQVKFSTSKKMDELVDKLDDEATENFVIARVSHSRITEYRKQLKIQAVKAARDKGGYIAEAIGEQLGAAVTIIEPGEYGNPYNALSQNYMFANVRGQGDQASEGVDFKKIKLRYEIMATFALR